MVFDCNKLRVLMWKCVLLRQRNWFLTLLDIAAPIFTFYLFYLGVYGVLYVLPYTEEKNVVVMYYTPRDIFDNEQVLTEIAFHADTIRNIAIMGYLSLYNYTHITFKRNITELEPWLYNKTIASNPIIQALGVSFPTELVHLTYTIRSTHPNMVTEEPDTEASILFDPYKYSGFLQTQTAIDVSLFKSLLLDILKPGEAFIEQFPNIVSFDTVEVFRALFVILSLAYVFLVISIVRDVVQEKLSGIKELMKIMGLPSWMIWVQWIIYTLIVHVPVTLIGTYLLTCFRAPIVPANPVLVWLLLFMFTINSMFLSFILSCFFNGPTTATLFSVGAWFSVHIAACIYINPKNFSFFFQILFCFLPLNNLLWALWSINSFDTSGVTWTLKYLFTVGSTGSDISVGLSLIISILITIVLIVILVFLDSINPGPYGVGKPITFICQWLRTFIWRIKKPDYVRSSLPSWYEPPPSGYKVGIEIRGLQKIYGFFKKVVAVEKVDLDIYEGEIMALLGHNGAGKTTTMSMITGMVSPNNGIIRFNGEDISTNSKYRNSLGVCTQHNLYFPKLTVIEHLIFFGMLRGMSYREAKTAGMKQLHKLNISNKSNSFGAALSGGMKRRLCLAVSLVGEPKYLILDEPTSGLDPQSRRQLWNIILDMRGQRTILITTHFMEEADVLGDRIAIMDRGCVVCCGTTMFLKRIYGTGYHLHVLKTVNASSDNIINKIRQHVANPQVKISSPTQIDFIIQDDSVQEFPGLFAALEGNRDSLGITGISVTCTTMEDVFLNVAEKNIKEDTAIGIKSVTPSSSRLSKGTNWVRIKGFDLLFVRYKILLWKIWRYQFRKTILTLIKVVLTCILMWYVVTKTKRKKIFRKAQPPLEISLSIFKNYTSVVQYDDEGKSLADIATRTLEKHYWKVENVPSSENFTKFLTDLYINDFKKFSNMLLYLRFSNRTIKIYYKNRLHLSAVAANLLTSTIYKSSYYSGLIRVFNHPYVPETEYCVGKSVLTSFFLACGWTVALFISLLFMIIEPIQLLIEERVSGFKHQQTLAGVTPILYWTSNLTYYYCFHLCIIFIYVLIIVVVGGKVIMESELLGILVLVLLLYGISGICFVYPFTFFVDNVVIGVSIFVVGSIFIGILPAILYVLDIFTRLHYLFCLCPLYSLSLSIYYIAFSISHAYFCKTCNDWVSCAVLETPLLVIADKENEHGILLNILFLAFSWLLYFGIVLIFDSEFIRWILLRIFYRPTTYNSSEEDEDVKRENELIRILRERNDQHTPLKVDSISKTYLCGSKAVSNVSFVVVSGERFGLLGINGAGKSTTFKVLTGESFPNSGDSIILSESVISSRRKYQSCIGYCPQFDAFVDTLTGEEIVTIIGRLRGIPKKDLKGEVDDWVNVMGIAEYVKNQSGTYSGGTKRKLSTAMSFIGNPIVVFLDEPTTGVDPESRRKLWTVMETRQQDDQAIVLSSHSMEECETLCTRLTIMRDGKLMCIGSPEYLKSKFSQGYIVLIKLQNPTDQKTAKFKKAFEESFPGSAIVDEHTTLINYEIKDPNVSISRLFTVILKMKDKYDIVEDFSVSNASMEQVFMSFTKGNTDSR